MATIEQNLTQLVQDRDDLVTNLTTKGITGLTGDETFTELVSEVLNISSGIDWSAIGYNEIPQDIQDKYELALNVKNNWGNTYNISNLSSSVPNLCYMPLVNTSSETSFANMFDSMHDLVQVPELNTSSGTNFSKMFHWCSSLTEIPLLDTSSGTNMNAMFYECYSLISVPQLDTSNNKDFSKMFDCCLELRDVPILDTSSAIAFEKMFGSTEQYVSTYDKNLTNTSLNNILRMLANATLYTGTKTLKYIGLSPSQATTCTTLSNWSAAQNAGWTTGF